MGYHYHINKQLKIQAEVDTPQTGNANVNNVPLKYVIQSRLSHRLEYVTLSKLSRGTTDCFCYN